MTYSQIFNAQPGLLKLMEYDFTWDKKVDLYDLIRSLGDDMGLFRAEMKRIQAEYVIAFTGEGAAAKPVMIEGKTESQYQTAIDALISRECPKQYKKIYLSGNDFPGKSPTVDEMLKASAFVEFKKNPKGKDK